MAKKKKEELLVIDTQDNNILLDDKFDKNAIINELKEYVDERVNDVFLDELERANKKLIREKNKKIFWKNVIIILLLLIIGFLLYLLYSNDYFDRFFNKNSEIEEKEQKDDKNTEEKKEEDKEDKKDNEEEKKEEKKEPTQEELKKEYEHLLDNYYVTDNSIYLSDFYSGKLTKEMMMYMTLNSFDFSSFSKEEDYNIIKESTFKIMFEKLFNEEYISGSFNYDENKVRYVKQMESYMTEAILVREESNIKREIKDIKVDGDEVIITTVEGIVKDNQLRNIISNELISDYIDGSLLKNEDKLNTVVYSFKYGKLIGLTK